jgi:hypothetical protein
MLIADRLRAALTGDPNCRVTDRANIDLVAKVVTASTTRRLVLTQEARDLSFTSRKKHDQFFDFLPLLSNIGGPIWIEWLAGPEAPDPDKIRVDRLGVLIYEETIKIPGKNGYPFLHMQEVHSYPKPDEPQVYALSLSAVTTVVDGNEPIRWYEVVDSLGQHMAMERPVFMQEFNRYVDVAKPEIAAEAAAWRAAHPKEVQQAKTMTPKDQAFNRRLHFQPSMSLMALLMSEAITPQRYGHMMMLGAEEDGPDYGAAMMAACLVRAGAFETKAADLERLNKARIKRRRPTFLSHEIVDTPNAYRRQLHALGLSAREIAEHLRRGHFRRLRDADGAFGQRVTFVRPTIVGTRLTQP